MAISQNILVATDFSDGARLGLEKAAQLARAVDAKVTVCHVLDPSPMAPVGAKGAKAAAIEHAKDVEAAIHEALREVVAEHFAGLERAKTALIMSPNAALGLCHYAEKEGADLIVLSTHGRTGLSHLLIGSVAERVVRHASCPVLTVRVPGG